ncbi:MAG TPA: nuclear transport factor 2 family protein [Pyrinomonadaceae bacterium]|nr:nuclear transport factor 2 family protein [Pyrinomonadaceae bacterium]
MMKRKNLFILTAVVVAIPLCLAQIISAAKSSTNNQAENSLDQMIVGKSRETWEAYKTRNIGAIKALAAPEYGAFTQTGPSNLQEDIANIQKLTIASYTIDEPRVSRVTKDVVILRYRCDLKGSFDGKPFVPVYATEVWVNRGGKWQIVSYQETAVT